MADITPHVADLVQRSRLGDQNATASIAVISTRAKRGDGPAKRVRNAIIKYATKNPPQPVVVSPTFGIDEPEPDEAVRVGRCLWRNLHTSRYSGAGISILVLSLGRSAPHLLADAPNLVDAAKEVRAAFSGEGCQAAFDLGAAKSAQPSYLSAVISHFEPPEQKALQLGYLIGKASRIQRVRDPRQPIAILALDTAWEMGE